MTFTNTLTSSSLTRRSIVGGFAALAVMGAVPLASATTPAPHGAFGCTLCAGRLSLSASGVRIDSTEGMRLIRSSGDAETDRFLGKALARLAGVFEVNPGFAFFESGDSDNAFATAQNLTGEGDGTVLMGAKLFGERMARDGDDGMTVIAICAHEFGHIHQMSGGYEAELTALDSTAKPVELHADFLAGFYLSGRKAEYATLNLQMVGRVFNEMGDTNFQSRTHHGTPEERTAAITAGYDFGRKSKGEGKNGIAEAARAGVAAVRQMM